MDKNTEVVLYRIVIELINNTIKHAFAKHITIDFKISCYTLVLTYKDDGIGFNMDKIIKKKNEGLGLNNIINRVKTIKARHEFFNVPGKGITFRIFIPLD